jgi:HD-GYP domain-containing protein (c-di-GMP phosphodiesterase class II)
MSYPSFHSFVKLLRSLLKRRQPWLYEESVFLADLCLAYGSIAGLSDRNKKTLFLAAHFKNLGALYLDNQNLEQEYSDHGEAITKMEALFNASIQLAKDAGLEEVADVLSQYHLRAIPQNSLARIFQVLNTWVSCRQRKGWRSSMSDKEALIILKQRAEMQWSDPKVVFHFIEHLCRYSSRADRREACTITGFQVPPEAPTNKDYSFDTLEDQFQSVEAETAGGL